MINVLLSTLTFLAPQGASEFIERLASDSIDERQDAVASLIRLGPAAIPDLEKAAKNEDTEVAVRAKEILQDNARFESRVVEHVVPQPVMYVCSPHHYARLFELGERAVPWVLKHAVSNPKARPRAYRYFWYYAGCRLGLPELALNWVVAEFNRGEKHVSLIRAIGALGFPEHVGKLEELAQSADSRLACVAVQAIAGIGTTRSREALERLASAASSAEARKQCGILLDRLFRPFDDDPGEVMLLAAIEKNPTEALRYGWGGWFRSYDLLLRRVIRMRRFDLLPDLKSMADRLEKHERTVLGYKKASLRLIYLWRAIHYLGGTLGARAWNGLDYCVNRPYAPIKTPYGTER